MSERLGRGAAELKRAYGRAGRRRFPAIALLVAAVLLAARGAPDLAAADAPPRAPDLAQARTDRNQRQLPGQDADRVERERAARKADERARRDRAPVPGDRGRQDWLRPDWRFQDGHQGAGPGWGG